MDVIIPAHNEETSIQQTIQSVKDSLKFIEHQVIVVCDACTDNTFELSKKYADVAIKVNNKNIAKTRNAGVKYSKYDTLLFIDADTQISEHAVREGLRILKDPQYSVVGVTWDHCDKIVQHIINGYMRFTGTAAGYFLMCRKSQFIPFPPSTSTEDVVFCHNMQRFGKTYLMKNSDVVSSDRRFVNNGNVKTLLNYINLENVVMLILNYLKFIFGIVN